MAEHFSVAEVVAGSNPVDRPTKKTDDCRLFFLNGTYSILSSKITLNSIFLLFLSALRITV